MTEKFAYVSFCCCCLISELANVESVFSRSYFYSSIYWIMTVKLFFHYANLFMFSELYIQEDVLYLDIVMSARKAMFGPPEGNYSMNLYRPKKRIFRKKVFLIVSRDWTNGNHSPPVKTSKWIGLTLWLDLEEQTVAYTLDWIRIKRDFLFYKWMTSSNSKWTNTRNWILLQCKWQ